MVIIIVCGVKILVNYFRSQIIEDIEYIQAEYLVNNPFLKKQEYAFNYWILTKLFNIDEEVVEENITEYKDDGIDCYVYFEEAKELYIIQNKFYGDNTKVDRRYIEQDFLIRPLNSLKNGNYKRSEELQIIYDKNKNDSDFKIHLYLYVTNDLKDQTVIDSFEKYRSSDNSLSCYVDAKIFYLKDIQNQYYEERKEDAKTFTCDFLTINDGTVLNINSESYNLPNLIDAKYILTPVSQIYNILNSAREKEYPLFDKNIREYLGNKGINSKIAKTLESKEDRDNFFYYNNGITVICNEVKKSNEKKTRYNKGYRTKNPQIVNGCQTVNTIYEVLNKYNKNDIDVEFRDTFVMVKLLVLDSSKKEHENLYSNIVRYNNSQNKIDEKAFEANKQIYMHLQKELEKRGFLLSVKQSDKYSFKKNKNFNEFRPKLDKYEKLFDIGFSKVDDIIIPLEKFLQVILAFDKGGYQAFTKKSQVLKLDSPISYSINDFIKNSGFTMDDMLNLYLLFLKADKEKKNSEDKRSPIPYYLIGFIGNKFSVVSNSIKKKGIDFIFRNETTIDSIYRYYCSVTTMYKLNYKKDKNIEYNQMIKSQIDDGILYTSLEYATAMNSSALVKQNISEFNNIFNQFK